MIKKKEYMIAKVREYIYFKACLCLIYHKYAYVYVLFCCSFPLKINMNLDAVVTPENYRGFFSLNKNIRQSNFGNNTYLAKKIERKYISGNSSFKSVPNPPHVNL